MHHPALSPAILVLLAFHPVQEPNRPGAGGPTGATASPIVQEPPSIQILPVQYAAAGELMQILHTFREPGDTITCDARTNALVLTASSADRLETLRTLVVRLDRPAEQPADAEPRRELVPESDIFAPVTRDMVIEFGQGGESPNLLAIARQYERLTGQMFLVSAETETLMTNVQTGLGAAVNVPAASVQIFLENLFVFHGLYIVPVPGTEPKLIQVYSIRSTERPSPPRMHYLLSKDVEAFGERHPAVPISTIYTMNNVDVRLLSNSMRTMFPDPFMSQLLPAGATNSLVITGTASSVVSMIRMLHTIEQSAASSAAQPATTPQ